ncbi:uncharacterized protein LOC135289971 isoform X2 [Passer domesticus]|uniref:uncharacterized protein LOC135289971 isoform X2 n=1 Tax=Passer domesticus TaxID=48849 RepID=UPI0030FEC002
MASPCPTQTQLGRGEVQTPLTTRFQKRKFSGNLLLLTPVCVLRGVSKPQWPPQVYLSRFPCVESGTTLNDAYTERTDKKMPFLKLPSPPHFLPPVQEMIEDLPVLQTHSMKKYFSELPLMTALTSMLRGISTERRKAEISTCAPKRGVLEDPLFRRVILGFYRIKWLTIHQMSPGCKL